MPGVIKCLLPWSLRGESSEDSGRSRGGLSPQDEGWRVELLLLSASEGECESTENQREACLGGSVRGEPLAGQMGNSEPSWLHLNALF